MVLPYKSLIYFILFVVFLLLSYYSVLFCIDFCRFVTIVLVFWAIQILRHLIRQNHQFKSGSSHYISAINLDTESFFSIFNEFDFIS